MGHLDWVNRQLVQQTIWSQGRITTSTSAAMQILQSRLSSTLGPSKKNKKKKTRKEKH